MSDIWALGVSALLLFSSYSIPCTARTSNWQQILNDDEISRPIFERNIAFSPSKQDFCGIESVFHGKWEYWQEPDSSYPTIKSLTQLIEGAYSQCPRTLISVISERFLTYQPPEYSCDERFIKPAHFIPHNCEIMHEHKAVSELSKHFESVGKSPIQVKFIGDSIGGQAYVALLCALESKNLSSFFNVTFQMDMLFRRDIPCEPNCTLPGTQGEEFRAKHKPLIHNPCVGCQDGVRRDINDVENNALWAKALLSPESKIDFLVLNSGAWYSYYSKIMNSTQNYEVMLKYVLLPSIKKVLERHPSMRIYWLDLPPFIATNSSSHPFKDLADSILSNAQGRFNRSVANASFSIPANVSEALDIQVQREYFKNDRSKEGFEWHLMEEKNELARKYLKSVGVHYLDTRPALLPRKRKDPMVSTDGLHWW